MTHISYTTHLRDSSFLRYGRNHRLEFAVFRQPDWSLSILAPHFLSSQHRRFWASVNFLYISQHQHNDRNFCNFNHTIKCQQSILRLYHTDFSSSSNYHWASWATLKDHAFISQLRSIGLSSAQRRSLDQSRKRAPVAQHSVVQYGRLLRVAWRVDCKNIRWEPDPQQFL